jgi:hypothetical protein
LGEDSLPKPLNQHQVALYQQYSPMTKEQLKRERDKVEEKIDSLVQKKEKLLAESSGNQVIIYCPILLFTILLL